MTRAVVLIAGSLLCVGLSPWLSVAGSDAAGSQKSGKPVRERHVIVDYAREPDSLAEMVRDPDAAIVRGVVQDRRAVDVDLAGIGTRELFTYYSVKVLEVFKQGSNPVEGGSSIEVRRPGGEIEREAYIERVRDGGFRQFQLQGHYVLFLEWNPYARIWGLRWGPNGVFDITSGSVEVPGWGKALVAQRGRSAQELLKTLRGFKP